MLVLFLDFDGCLNSHQTDLMRRGKEIGHPKFGEEVTLDEKIRRAVANIDPYNAWNVAWILENVPELKIVIHSRWTSRYSLDELREVLSQVGISREAVIDRTPRRLTSEKCHEIGMWLHDSVEDGFGVVDNWVAVDDSVLFDLNSPRKPHEYKVSPLTGLTYPDACSIIRRFKPEWEQPKIAF